MLTVTPPPKLKLFFICVPHALSLIDDVEVITPALRLTVGILPALATFMPRSLLSMPSFAFFISGRCSSEAAYTSFSAGTASSAMSSVVEGTATSNSSSLVICSSSFSWRL